MTLNDDRKLNAAVTIVATQANIGAYARWTGTMKETVGGEVLEGTALWGQFKLTAPGIDENQSNVQIWHDHSEG